MTLLHYIALIIKEKFPELANFCNELHFVEKAAAGEFTLNIKLSLPSPKTLCLFAGWFVCLKQDYTNRFGRISMKPGRRMQYGSGKNPIKFGVGLDHGEDPGIYFHFL